MGLNISIFPYYAEFEENGIYMIGTMLWTVRDSSLYVQLNGYGEDHDSDGVQVMIRPRPLPYGCQIFLPNIEDDEPIIEDNQGPLEYCLAEEFHKIDLSTIKHPENIAAVQYCRSIRPKSGVIIYRG